MRLTITHEMEEGNPEHIRPYLKELKHIPGFKLAHLVPAESVIKQFQIDTSTYEPAEALEKKVLATGKNADEIIADGETPIFHLAIPYIAQQECLSCHTAEKGDVLGAVSLEIDMGQQRKAMISSMTNMLLLFLFFGVIITIALRKLMAPIISTTKEIKQAFGKAQEGDFSVRLVKRSNDEIGDIAEQTNHMMQLLENSLGKISKEIESLHDARDNDRHNILQHTVDVVHNMVTSTHFKKTIENDRDLDEVYSRLSHELVNRFNIQRFSIYEVSNSNNRMQLILSQGLPEGAELWCNREITIDCDACRAKRTADIISSAEEHDICSSFSGNIVQQNEKLLHSCIPIILSGSVGGVLQLIFTEEEAEEVKERLTTVAYFLEEAAPVIESKRLMRSLKDASMRDPMTNLYNRRFLEGYLDTLMASVERQKACIGVLMCDVDLFKQVNDTYGHETGDEVLIKVSEILKHSVRASDMVIRYGGEEFLALLIGADETKTLEVAERVRTEMESHAFSTTSGPLKKTISVGASLYPQDSDSFWECVKFADVALYQAKETGRNKSLRYTKDMWKEEEKES
ncbi:diguanylate cyclase [Pseudomonadota bacterium]